MKLERTRDQWEKCDPEAMSKMSQSAIYFALKDAKHDILALHAELVRAASTQSTALLTGEQIAALRVAADALTERYAAPIRAVLANAEHATATQTTQSEVDIKALVNRFLAWPLPQTVAADGCATNSAYAFPRSGTHLLNADEAEAMLRYVLTAQPLQPERAIADAQAELRNALVSLECVRQWLDGGCDPKAAAIEVKGIMRMLQGAARTSDAAAAGTAEPVAWQYLYTDLFGNGDVWRNDGYEWNGQRPKGSRALYTHAPVQTADVRAADLKRAVDLLDTSLGDSDPMLRDDMTQEDLEHEYPVMAAMQILVALLEQKP